MITSFEFDWCYLVIDPETGFCKVLDIYDSIEMNEFYTIDEALAELAEIELTD